MQDPQVKTQIQDLYSYDKPKKLDLVIQSRNLTHWIDTFEAIEPTRQTETT